MRCLATPDGIQRERQRDRALGIAKSKSMGITGQKHDCADSAVRIGGQGNPHLTKRTIVADVMA
jgi:hypothetical protein